MQTSPPSRAFHIIAWTAGVVFVLAGIGGLGSAPVRSVLLIAGGALLIPPSAAWIERKANFVMSRWSRVFVYIVGFFLAVSVAGSGGTAEQGVSSPPQPTAAQAEASSADTPVEASSTPSLQLAESSAASMNPDEAYVLDAIDGDTLRIRLADGTVDKVRIIGIDTPETVDPRKAVQCFGTEGSARMASLVKGKTITLVRNPAEDRDVYQRLLRYIDLDGTDIGAGMIAHGYAFSYKTYPHPRLAEYNALEKSARSASKGLWGTCPASGGEERASRPSQTTQAQESSMPVPVAAPVPITTQQCAIKGNISAKGEKIYHMLGCGSYKQTVIDESKGERWFCTEDDAQAAGWRKAENC